MNKLENLLYFFGTAILLSGFTIFIVNVWGSWSYSQKIIAITFPAFLCFFLGLVCRQFKIFSKLGIIFCIISALMLPFGIVACMKGIGNFWGLTPYQKLGPIGLPFLMFSSAALWFKDRLTQSIAILYGTWMLSAVLALLPWSLTETWWYAEVHFAALALLVLVLSYAFRNTNWGAAFELVGYPLGVFLVLIATIINFPATVSPYLDYLFIPVIIICVLLGFKLKRKLILCEAFIFLVINILAVFNEHFHYTLNFPIILILIGMLFLLFGYLWVRLHKKQ